MLSIGALEKIHQGVDISDPVLQVLGYKAIPGSDPTRFRIHISDGQFSTSDTILATNLNHLIGDKSLDKFSIVRVTKLVCNKVPAQPNKLVILLLEVEVITPGVRVGGRFGNPVQLEIDTKFSPAPMALCPHCHRHNHPPRAGTPPAENRRVAEIADAREATEEVVRAQASQDISYRALNDQQNGTNKKLEAANLTLGD